MSDYYRAERAAKGEKFGLYLVDDVDANGCEICAEARIILNYDNGSAPIRYGKYDGGGQRLMFCPFKECPYKEDIR